MGPSLGNLPRSRRSSGVRYFAGGTEGAEAFGRQSTANGGVFADEFIRAAEWCKVTCVNWLASRVNGIDVPAWFQPVVTQAAVVR